MLLLTKMSVCSASTQRVAANRTETQAVGSWDCYDLRQCACEIVIRIMYNWQDANSFVVRIRRNRQDASELVL